MQAFQATDAPLSSIPIYAGQMAGKEGNTQAITVMDQCMTEQRYVRDSITRSLIYNQVRSRAATGRVVICEPCIFGILDRY